MILGRFSFFAFFLFPFQIWSHGVYFCGQIWWHIHVTKSLKEIRPFWFLPKSLNTKGFSMTVVKDKEEKSTAGLTDSCLLTSWFPFQPKLKLFNHFLLLFRRHAIFNRDYFCLRYRYFLFCNIGPTGFVWQVNCTSECSYIQ